MRTILAFDFNEAANHREFLANVLENLNWEKDVRDEFGNVKGVIKGDRDTACLRAAVALGLAPVITLLHADEKEFPYLRNATLRYREIITGESMEQNLELLAETEARRINLLEDDSTGARTDETPPEGNESATPPEEKTTDRTDGAKTE